MTEDLIRDALDKLRGAVTIVYPMQLPPYDPIRLEFEGKEDLSGTQVALTNDIMSLKQRHYLQEEVLIHLLQDVLLLQGACVLKMLFNLISGRTAGVG